MLENKKYQAEVMKKSGASFVLLSSAVTCSWKNSVWHVYEPVSFDLVEPSSIVEKANRWVGRSASLAESDEPFKLHLLVGEPQHAKLHDAFRKANNILRKMTGSPDLVMEANAEVFAADLEREIGVHGDPTHNLFDFR